MKSTNIGKIAVLAFALFAAGCSQKPTFQSFEKLPVDQLFLDHDGYTITYTDQNRQTQRRKMENYGLGGYSKSEVNGLPLETPEGIVCSLASFNKGMDKEKNAIHVFNDLPDTARGYANILTYSISGPGDMGFVRTEEMIEIHRPEHSKLNPGSEVYGGKFHIVQPIHEVE